MSSNNYGMILIYYLSPFFPQNSSQFSFPMV